MSGKRKANFALWFSCGHENDECKWIRKNCTPILFHFVSWSRLASGCQITTQQGRLAKLVPVKLIAANHLFWNAVFESELWHFVTFWNCKNRFSLCSLSVRASFVVRLHEYAKSGSVQLPECNLLKNERLEKLVSIKVTADYFVRRKIRGKCILAFQIWKAFLISCNALFWA